MKRMVFVVVVVFLMSSEYPYRQDTALQPARNRDFRTVYEMASAVTGAPERALVAIAFAESSLGVNVDHPNPVDRGWFGLHEDPEYRAERVAKYGEYNADIPADAAIITGRLYTHAMSVFHDEDKAISAHHRGITWVIKNGVDHEYVSRAKSIFN